MRRGRVRHTEKDTSVTAEPEFPDFRVSISERAKRLLWLWHQQNKLYHTGIWVLCYYSWNTMFMSGICSTNGLIMCRRSRENMHASAYELE